MPTEAVRSKRTLTGTQINVLIFVASISMCAIAPLTNSGIYLIVPLLGVASIIVSIVKRSWWTIPLGVLEIVSPEILHLIVDYILWHS